jgi:sugar phosphate isomerase/epimerase
MTVRQGFTIEGEVDLAEALAFAADRGFEFVELNMDYAFERQRVGAERVRALADEHGLDLVVHLPYRVDPGSHHEHARVGACRELEAAVDAAVEMGADRGVMHATSRAHPAKWAGEEIRPRIYESVRRVDAHACLDTGHAMVAGYDLAWQADLLREHGDRIAHVHLNTRRGEGGEDEHLPVGIGDKPFEELTGAMRETGWDGTCTHEVFGFDPAFVALGKENVDGWLAGA